MKILNINSAKLSSPSAVALGMFDGVHLGHREVIEAAIKYGREHSYKTAVITLRNHPREFTQGKAPLLITNLDTRLALFEELGIDYALVLDFNESLMNTSARDYLQKYLIDILNTSFISTGYDHHFGKNRTGTPAMLENWAAERSLPIKIIPAYKFNGKTISSSEIRDLITKGDIVSANQMLGYKFMIISQVIEGDKRGRTLGFPTANLKLPSDMVIPAKGVYQGSAEYQGKIYKAVMNIGTRPSFTEANDVIIEAHLLNFDQDIYGKKLTLRIEKRIRDEKKFNSAEELIEQIKLDIKSSFNH